jgi:uncharacterized protein (TIGR04255 family)
VFSEDFCVILGIEGLSLTPMPFPTAERVIYGKNPLVNVRFTVRFGRILQLDSELPADFQKAILAKYPLLEERKLWRVTVSRQSAAPSETSPSKIGKEYEFQSADRVWKVALSSDALSVSTAKYQCWDDFRSAISEVLTIFLQIYNVPVFTSLSLTYQNIIDRSLLNLTGRKWSELLRPHMAGEFIDESFREEEFEVRQSTFRIVLNEHEAAQSTHGLVRKKNDEEVAYRLDNVFSHNQNIEATLDATISVADRLNTSSGSLFHWAIQPTLHDAMEPKPVSRLER